MWKQIETSRNNILLYLNYEDFATIEVEKKTNNKVHINHDPQAESSRAVFGEPKAKGDEFTPRTFK